MDCQKEKKRKVVLRCYGVTRVFLLLPYFATEFSSDRQVKPYFPDLGRRFITQITILLWCRGDYAESEGLCVDNLQLFRGSLKKRRNGNH